jgi:hypothetical protein
MSLTYTTYVSSLANLAVQQQTDPNFIAVLPNVIDDAEQRIYRELDLLATNVVDTTTTLLAGTRTAVINTNFIVTNNVSILTPAGSTASSGTRVPLNPVSIDVVNTLWPNASITGQPSMYAMQDQWTLIFGPSPNGAYVLEVVGTQRPAPLSASNTTTFLTSYLPDLFLAASMVFMSAYMRNWGTMASDPAQGMSWEQHYQLLKGSAMNEELRKLYWGSSWSPYPVSAEAQPQRG